METALFYMFSGITLTGGLLVVLQRNPVSSAVALVVSFFGLAALFVMLEAHFVAAMQVLLYAGAIMVLFVFVIMLLNLREKDIQLRAIAGKRLLPAFAAIYFGGLVMVAVMEVARQSDTTGNAPQKIIGNVAAVGESLLSTYSIPFELTSLVLLISVIGAVYLGRHNV